MKSSSAIAIEFLKLAREAGRTLSVIQVLKLVYLAHGWMLGLYHRPLIKDDVKAWQYGPAIPALYSKIRKYRWRPVTHIEPEAGEDLDERELDIVHQVFDLYGDLSGRQLSAITHADGTPWDLTYEPGKFGALIPNDLIEAHFAELAG